MLLLVPQFLFKPDQLSPPEAFEAVLPDMRCGALA
jgi:hypothetical protein